MELQIIEITRIVEDPDQPRRAIDDVALAGLADSIRQHGILNPITVAPLQGVDGFRIVTGERRWRASQLAGLLEMPCIVREEAPTDTADRTAEQLIENLQREELAPLDKARAIRTLKESLDANNREVGQRLGLSERTVGYLLDLLDLPEHIGEQIIASPNRPSDGNLTEKHGRFLKAFNEQPELQEHLVEKIRGDKLTADDTGKIARALRDNPDRAEEILGASVADLPRLVGGGDSGGGGRGTGSGGGGQFGREREVPGGYDGGPYANLDEKPLFTMGGAFTGLLVRARTTIEEVRVSAVSSEDLSALEEALAGVQAALDQLRDDLRRVRG